MQFKQIFCRWFEDQRVAERLIEIWPIIVDIIYFWEKLPTSKCPSCKSYQSVLLAVKDDFTPAKLFQLYCKSFTTLFNKVQDGYARVAISQCWLEKFESETSRTHYQAWDSRELRYTFKVGKNWPCWIRTCF